MYISKNESLVRIERFSADTVDKPFIMLSSRNLFNGGSNVFRVGIATYVLRWDSS